MDSSSWDDSLFPIETGRAMSVQFVWNTIECTSKIYITRYGQKPKPELFHYFKPPSLSLDIMASTPPVETMATSTTAWQTELPYYEAMGTIYRWALIKSFLRKSSSFAKLLSYTDLRRIFNFRSDLILINDTQHRPDSGLWHLHQRPISLLLHYTRQQVKAFLKLASSQS